MVGIHLQIALHIHCQIKKTMPCKTVKHMVEKTNPCMDLCLSCPVQIKGNMNICLAGDTADLCFSLLHVLPP